MKDKGFTLVELLVTVSIFVIINSMILVSYPQLSSQVSLFNATQEVALAFREAQTKAMGVYAFYDNNSIPPKIIHPPFGVYFNINTPQEFVIFADANQNNIYDGLNEFVSRFFTQKSRISELKVVSSSGAQTVSDLATIYTRPDPRIIINNNSIIFSTEVYVSAPNGSQNKVIIWTTGLVQIEKVI